jgi:hypothetical protein
MASSAPAPARPPALVASLFGAPAGSGGRHPHSLSYSWPPPLGRRSRPCGVWVGPTRLQLGNDPVAPPSLEGCGGPFSPTGCSGLGSPLPPPFLAGAPFCPSSWLLLLLHHSGLHPAIGKSPSSLCYCRRRLRFPVTYPVGGVIASSNSLRSPGEDLTYPFMGGQTTSVIAPFLKALFCRTSSLGLRYFRDDQQTMMCGPP